jgi:outer membrane protein assembly factor BamB
MTHLFRCAAVLFALISGSATLASDWPQFQGPERNGTSPENGLARTWPEGGPKVLWTNALQEGFGGPAIRDGEVYFLDREEDARDVLRCLSLTTGETRWMASYDAPGSTSHDGSRTTPTVTDTHVYTVGLMGHFTCFDRASQEIAWQIDLLEEYETGLPNWGFSQSPLLYNDLIIVAPQARDAFVCAYDRKTGKQVWASPTLGSTGYSSPVIATLGGQEQVVMVSGPRRATGTVAGLSLEDGSTLWRYDGWKCKIPIPSATPLPDDRLFITGEYGAGSAMIQVKREGDSFNVKELFTTQKIGSQIHQPLLIDNVLYANSNGNKRRDGMVCMTLDGEVMWRTDDSKALPNFERGNLLYADGMIINFDGKTGVLHLVSPSPRGYVEIAQAPILKGKRMWSPMALSDGKLVLRSQSEVKCLDLRNPQ